jgi:iron complex transport system substrate-binding protein
LRKSASFWAVATTGAVLLGALFFAEAARAQGPPSPAAAPPAVTEKPAAPKAAQPAAFSQGSSAYRDVVDETGRTVRVPETAERIVSLAPNLTETLYALGLQDRLVGDTEYCDYPADAQKKPKVGGAINPSIELVAALHPDLVLVASINRYETVRALDDLNIPVYGTDPHSVEQIIASTTKLADVLGAGPSGAELGAALERRLADLQARLKELPLRRVLFVVWTDPLISVGKNTFIADALGKAGAISIVESTQDWPHLSLEEAVRLQPEYLVFTAEHDNGNAAALQALNSRPGWRSLEAVKNHRIAVISEAVDRPAPRIISAIEDLARQLHPEAFEKTPEAPAQLEKEKSEPPPGAAPSNTAPPKNAAPPGVGAPQTREECGSARSAACNR